AGGRSTPIADHPENSDVTGRRLAEPPPSFVNDPCGASVRARVCASLPCCLSRRGRKPRDLAAEALAPPLQPTFFEPVVTPALAVPAEVRGRCEDGQQETSTMRKSFYALAAVAAIAVMGLWTEKASAQYYYAPSYGYGYNTYYVPAYT